MPITVSVLGGQLFRAGIEKVVQELPDVVLDAEKPSVVVLLGTGEATGGPRCGEAPDTAPSPVLVVDASADLRDVCLFGVACMVHAEDGPEDLARAIRAAAVGSAYCGPALSRALMFALAVPAARDEQTTGRQARWLTLSVREREVAGCVLAGWSNDEVARSLGVCTATVKHHLVSVYAKLGICKRSQLVLYLEEARRTAADEAVNAKGVDIRKL